MDKHHAAWLERHADRDEAWLTAKLKEGFDVHHLDRTPAFHSGQLGSVRTRNCKAHDLCACEGAYFHIPPVRDLGWRITVLCGLNHIAVSDLKIGSGGATSVSRALPRRFADDEYPSISD